MKLPPLPLQNGLSLTILQAEGVLGGSVWPCAPVLCQFLLDHYYPRSKGTAPNVHAAQDNYDVTFVSTPQPQHSSANNYYGHVLELGSGTGAVGIFAAALGIFQSVHLTEHKPSVQDKMLAAPSSVPYDIEKTFSFEQLQSKEASSSTTSSSSDDGVLLELLRHNVEHNTPIAATIPATNQHDTRDTTPNPSWPPVIHELDWGIPQHARQILETTFPGRDDDDDDDASDGFEILLASDITYRTELMIPLAATMAQLLSSSTTGQSIYDDSPRKNKNTMTTTTARPPHCLVAHCTRFLDVHGEDLELKCFHDALRQVGLDIVQTHSCSSSSRPISILEIQRARNSERDDTLWLPQ